MLGQSVGRGGWVFQVEPVTATLGAETTFIRLRIGAGGAPNTIVDLDDVRAFVLP